MSTATEIMAMMEAAAPHMDKLRAVLQERFGDMTTTAMVGAFGREVGARRMRKLRRRGEAVRFHGWTSNGKARYRWLPKTAVEWKV